MNLTINIKNHGAIGDGVTKDTAAIQRAIELCSQSGGGTVLIPAGTYLTGTLYLRSKIHLQLESGATLLGSPDITDYNPDEAYPQNTFWKPDIGSSGAHLIIALEVEDVSITGFGVIDGNGPEFFGPLYECGQTGTGIKYKVKGKRPGTMVTFVECKKVYLRDIQLNRSPNHNLLFHGCEEVHVSGIKINNPFETHNGDGIGVNCSRNVIIDHSSFHTGDDCITFGGNADLLKNKSCITENVVITNCVLSTPISGLRFYGISGITRNCTVSNCVINAKRGIFINPRYYDGLTQPPKGGLIENLRFSNLVIDAAIPIIIADSVPGLDRVRNIKFSNITAVAEIGCLILGNSERNFQSIGFHDINIQLGPVMEKRDGRRKAALKDEVRRFPEGTSPIYAAYTEDLSLSHVSIQGWNEDWPWQNAIHIAHSHGVSLHHITVRKSPPGNAGKILALTCVEQLEHSTISLPFSEGIEV